MRSLALFALVSLSVSAQEPPRVFKAGAAASNITPPLGEPIVGGWAPYPATTIHDELHARCLALDDGKTRLAIVVCDNVGIPRELLDQARALVEKELGLPGANLLISSTHTHSATSARGDQAQGDYARFLVRRIADGVRRAFANLKPARIGWGSAQAPEHLFNRRYFLKPEKAIPDPFGGTDKVLMNPGVGNADVVKPAGPTDPEVSFLYVRAQDDRPIALFATYSLHYVGGVPNGHVSADYFAVFADRVGRLLDADRLDPPFVGALSNGTSGDVNNINVLGARELRPPYEKMREVAHSVAVKVRGAVDAVPLHDWVPLGAAMKDLTLKTRKPTPEMLAHAREVLARSKDVKPRHVREDVYARRISPLADAPDEIAVPIQALRIGDLGIAAIPFEVFTDIGLDIKKRSPFPKAYAVSLANGSYGYLPTPEHHALGGYETWLGTNRVEVEASRKIADCALELLASLK
jgi:hypothetical protein